MNHYMFDCYNCNQTLLNDINYVNKVMNEIPYELGLKAIGPADLVPYYYGKVREDDGISAFLFLDGGHFTMHTFPYRKCYFVDIYADKDIDSSILTNYLSENLPYNQKLSSVSSRNRFERVFFNYPYEPKIDFGPHVLTEIETQGEVTMEKIYDFLEGLVVKIGMTPIIRPHVIKNRISDPEYISGIIMIAESHISLHYNIRDHVIFGDIFSCSPFDFTNTSKLYSEFGKVVSYEVVARGTKHYSKIANYKKDSITEACEKWKTNIL